MSCITKNSGIYQITCIDTGKIYIGSALSISHRIALHISNLRYDRHHNRYLQRAWNKYGQDSFTFEVLEECHEDKRLEREQFWVDVKKSYIKTIGFNIKRSVTDPNHNVKHYIVIFEDGSEKIIYNMRKFCRDNGLDNRSVCRVLKGEWSQYKGFKFRNIGQTKLEWEKSVTEKRKTGRVWKLGWIIMMSDGTEFFVQSVEKFARENNLDGSHLRLTAYGTYKQHKGMSCRKSTMSKEEWEEMYACRKIVKKEKIKKPKQYWIIEYLDGKETIVDNLAKFCRENNLDTRKMHKIRDKNRKHRGYKCRRVIKTDELCTV